MAGGDKSLGRLQRIFLPKIFLAAKLADLSPAPRNLLDVEAVQLREPGLLARHLEVGVDRAPIFWHHRPADKDRQKVSLASHRALPELEERVVTKRGRFENNRSPGPIGHRLHHTRHLRIQVGPLRDLGSMQALCGCGSASTLQASDVNEKGGIEFVKQERMSVGGWCRWF